MNLPKWTNLENNLLSLGPRRSRVAVRALRPVLGLARREPGKVQEDGQDLKPAAGAGHGDTG